MSYLGWRVVRYDFERRFADAHRAGKVHPWERSRILAGDLAPIRRELEPEFEVGEKHVLSRTRPRGSLVRDRVSGEEVLYPKPSPDDLFWITIRELARHRTGYWRVHFDVFDRRESDFYVRRKPPVYSIGQEEEAPPSPEQVVLDSAYTQNPAQALDLLAAVPLDYQNVLQMNADENWKRHQRDSHNTEVAKQQVRTIAQTAREYSITATKLGLDPTVILRELELRIEAELHDLERAA